jgi:hypothetical protein
MEMQDTIMQGGGVILIKDIRLVPLEQERGDNLDASEQREDMVMMKDGRVVTVRNGEMTPIEKETILPDGTRVMPDGRVVLTDGSTRMMHEGETMYMNSRMMNMANMPEEPAEEMEDPDTQDAS